MNSLQRVQADAPALRVAGWSRQDCAHRYCLAQVCVSCTSLRHQQNCLIHSEAAYDVSKSTLDYAMRAKNIRVRGCPCRWLVHLLIFLARISAEQAADERQEVGPRVPEGADHRDRTPQGHERGLWRSQSLARGNLEISLCVRQQACRNQTGTYMPDGLYEQWVKERDENEKKMIQLEDE